MLRERAVLLGALALLLYVAAEFGVSNWIVLYAQKELAFPVLAATSALSALWFGLMIGRLLNSRLALRRSSRELVLWSGVTGVICGLALLTARTPAVAYLWLFGLGLSMAGMYPNIMADVNSRYPIQMGLVTGFLAQAAALGIDAGAAGDGRDRRAGRVDGRGRDPGRAVGVDDGRLSRRGSGPETGDRDRGAARWGVTMGTGTRGHGDAALSVRN